MSKATHTFVTLALLVLAGTASAAPVSVRLDAHNQRSSSGVLSTLKWKACTTPPPITAADACLSTTASTGGTWANANATPSNAVWTWDAATGVLSMTGLFQSTSFISSNANGSPVISDRVVDMVIDTTNNTTTAASYRCVEGTFLASVGANGCLNVSLGDDFTNNSSAQYDFGGNALCVQRTVGGDDLSTGNARGVTTVAAAPPCDAQDGAFDLWNIQLDNTSSGGQLIIRNSVTIDLAGTNFLTFSAVPDAVDDGPFNAPQGVPITLDVLANDANFADPVTVTVSTAPTKGTAMVTGASPGPKAGIRIEYTANGDATGPDSFVYTATTAAGSDTATVTLDTLAFGANDDTAATTRNSAAIPINVGANDVGLADDVTIVIISAPNQGGTATPPAPGPAANAIVTYTPATTVPGTLTYTEEFTYEVTDASLLTSTATVTVTVSNIVPVANPGAVTISTQGIVPGTGTAIGTFNAGTLAGNSLGNTPSTVTFTQGTNGVVTGSGNLLTYTPAGTFFWGNDTFTYTITDSDPGTPESDTETVTVTVTDLVPALSNATITTTADTASAPRTLTITLGNGSAAQHPLTVSTPAANGTCALSSPTAVAGAAVTVTYTPNAGYTGGDSCIVTIIDEDGTGDSATGTVTITVNAAPGGGGGGTGGLLPGGSSAFDPWSLALLAGLPLLRRLRASRRRLAAGQQ